jgi:hypothetical protein
MVGVRCLSTLSAQLEGETEVAVAKRFEPDAIQSRQMVGKERRHARMIKAIPCPGLIVPERSQIPPSFAAPLDSGSHINAGGQRPRPNRTLSTLLESQQGRGPVQCVC